MRCDWAHQNNDLAQTLIFSRVGSHFLAAFGSQFSSRSVSILSRVGSQFLAALVLIF